MQTCVALLVLSLALAVNGSSLAGRIVGGTEAPEGKYPYQVSLWISTRFQCGGSIINNRYILTAAHCVYGLDANQMSVVVGTNSLTKAGKRFQVEKLIPHKGFSYETVNDDIALMRLSEEIVYSDKVQPISLPSSDYQQEGSSVVLTGWGRLTAGGVAPDKLQQIDLKVIDLKDCRRRQPSATSKHVCTLTKRGEGACNGDSGGPLVADGVEIGIVSYGKPCGVGWPDVYTRVQSYIDWIDEHIEAGGVAPDKLQQIDLKVIDLKDCRRRQPSATSKHVCTLTKRGEGACNGDSGGPLVADGVEIGIVSYGKPCGVGWPDVYTRVQSYIDWIDEHIEA